MPANLKILNILIQKGYDQFNKPYEFIKFTNIDESDRLLNNLIDSPHAFTLACIMDRQINAERAWMIPFKISQIIDNFLFNSLLNYSLIDYINIFNDNKLHRFNSEMAKNFYNAIQHIQTEYHGNASKIWDNKPNSAALVNRFLKFDGVGIKIASMAVNILARQFKIKLTDYHYIDISPDVHIKRVFYRIGFITKQNNIDELLYTARELNPSYPGIFDLSCWEIGRNFCKPTNPNCNNCYLNNYCPKLI